MSTTAGDVRMPLAAAPAAEDAPSAPRGPAPSSAAERDAESFVAEAFAQYVDAGTSLIRHVARHPRTALRVLRAIATLPAFVAALPAGPEAEAVRATLLEHAGSRRAMLGVSAVLAVPAEPGTYTDGHERATVRRKIRAAEKRHVTIRAVRDDEKADLLALANRHEAENERDEYRVARPENDDLLDYRLWLAAYDGEGAPIMLAVIPHAGEWAVLRYFRTLVAGQASSDARYLMAREVAEALGASGVRHLVDTARPHWLPNGLRHFQRMIGFRLVRVRTARVAKR